MEDLKKFDKFIIDNRQGLFGSIVRDSFTFSLLLLCIYVSQGSTWWTFLTGLFFILFMGARITVMLESKTKRFKSIEELREWVDALPDTRK